jgi:hypothetical protein
MRFPVEENCRTRARLIAAGVCALFGVFANKGHMWAFVTGMVLFALDGCSFSSNRIGSAWAACLVLYCLFRGAQACRQLKAV